ncbi:MAG: hypothetical protein ABR512_12295 [Desulfopila sp.]
MRYSIFHALLFFGKASRLEAENLKYAEEFFREKNIPCETHQSAGHDAGRGYGSICQGE